MKLSQTTLKKLIQEELSKLNEDEGKKLTHAKAKEYFLNAAAKVSDIDSNALDELTKMLELVTRAFTGNVNTSPMNVEVCF